MNFLVRQTFSETYGDLVTILTPPRRADIRAHRSICQNGLETVIRVIWSDDRCGGGIDYKKFNVPN